jgi:hypothetical protein
VQANLLIANGTRRGTSYVAGPILQSIRARIREGRVPIDPSEVFLAD